MSIIYDALKKIEPKVGTNHKKTGNKLGKYLLFLVVAGLGFFLASLYSDPFIKAFKKIASPPKSESRPPERPAKQLPTSQSKPTTQSGFVVNGIVSSEDGNYALLNNEIVKEGDTIGEAKVVAILEDGVELEIAGNKEKIVIAK